MRKIALIIGVSTALFTPSVLSQDSSNDLLFNDTELPVVLTAARLKQPKAEVPASVTVIEAEQIMAWGARTIPELMRFVPGMAVGGNRDETTETVVYHVSGQNMSRRLQVLVDGRSVYKSAIARIVWDDIPVALEDIRRIEVIRGPNSAIYGANAFLATINIITKSPEETLGTRIRYRQGNQGVQDAIISHSAMLGEGSLRLTGSYISDDGFDGADAKPGQDMWDDDKRNTFFSADYRQAINEILSLQTHLGASTHYAEVAASPTPDTNYLESNAFSLNTKLSFDFSENHQSHLQLYWQREDRTYIQYDERPTVLLDPDLAKLYQLNPSGVRKLINGDNSGFTAPEELALLNNIATRAGGNINELTQGYIDYNYIDQRVDVEWQDTIVWSDNLRTISGASYRRDEVYSKSVFGEWRSNETYRLFANAEWKIIDRLVLNAGGMYEKEELNDAVFSPRVALNTLLSDTQSIRMIYSQAVRSPDMMEQSPHMVMVARDLTDNYLGLKEATLGITNIAENRGLKHEQIASYELGYYYLMPDWNLELDIKVYKEELRHLIDDSINLENSTPTSDGWANIQGAEMQLKWQPMTTDWLWLTIGKMDVDTNEPKEERLSPKFSMVTSWFHQGQGWSSTLSHFYLDALSNNTKLYHRAELNLRKEWHFNRYKPWEGAFWQHQFARNALGYKEQIYSKPDVYYLQAGLNF